MSMCCRAFAMRLPAVPKLLLAIVDSGGSAASFFSNNFSQTMITEGNAIADQLEAHFMTSTANFQQQSKYEMCTFSTANCVTCKHFNSKLCNVQNVSFNSELCNVQNFNSKLCNVQTFQQQIV